MKGKNEKEQKQKTPRAENKKPFIKLHSKLCWFLQPFKKLLLLPVTAE